MSYSANHANPSSRISPAKRRLNIEGSKEKTTIMREGMEDMRTQAAAQAAWERAKMAVYRMLAAGEYSWEEITDRTEIALDEVKKMKSGQRARQQLRVCL